MSPRPGGGWRPTHAHLRAVIAGAIAVLAAVLGHRPDLLVLGVPLILVAVWGQVRRPEVDPDWTAGVDHATLREGQASSWRARVKPVPGCDDVGGVFYAGRWTQLQPMHGAVLAAADAPSEPAVVSATPATASVGGPVRAGQTVELAVQWRALRWGRQQLGPGRLVAVSGWHAYRWGPTETARVMSTVLPLPAGFDSTAPAPHPHGLVGLNRSAHPGEGSEFASIRPFQLGDRLRRIHWPVSLRAGELHVTSVYAEQDTHVVLVVDAFNDVGVSDGVDGRASSLDVTVRAAGAIAEHYLHRGERVSLRVSGTASVTAIPPATGKAHLLRVLGTLARISPATDQREHENMMQAGLTAGALVIMLSPLISPIPLGYALSLARRGLTVLVVDTLDPDTTGGAAGGVRVGDRDEDPLLVLAWRLRRLERDREIRRVQAAGVPVVAWRGAGSLDQVLRDLGQRAAAPRLAHR